MFPSRRRHSDREVLLRALRCFDERIPAGETRSWWRYNEWAAGYAEVALAEGWRIPRSGLVISRAFGSWENGLAAAGVVSEACRPRRRNIRTGGSSFAADTRMIHPFGCRARVR
jgi:hypothetical protein